MAGLPKDELPAKVATIVDTIVAWLRVPADSVAVFDHSHEGLRGGSYSILVNGDVFGWPHQFSEAVYLKRESVPAGWLLEAGTEHRLDVYPNN